MIGSDQAVPLLGSVPPTLLYHTPVGVVQVAVGAFVSRYKLTVLVVVLPALSVTVSVMLFAAFSFIPLVLAAIAFVAADVTFEEPLAIEVPLTARVQEETFVSLSLYVTVAVGFVPEAPEMRVLSIDSSAVGAVTSYVKEYVAVLVHSCPTSSMDFALYWTVPSE